VCGKLGTLKELLAIWRPAKKKVGKLLRDLKNEQKSKGEKERPKFRVGSSFLLFNQNVGHFGKVSL
jgi:hypothetical protein